MVGFGAVHIGITTEGVVMDFQIVGFVVVECFAKKTSESTIREAKFAEKFLCFHILCFFVDNVLFLFDAAKLWRFLAIGKKMNAFLLRLLRQSPKFATKTKRGRKSCRIRRLGDCSGY